MLPLGLINQLGPWSGLFTPQLEQAFPGLGLLPQPGFNQFGFSPPTPAPQSPQDALGSTTGRGVGLIPFSPPGGGTGGGLSPQELVGDVLKMGKTGVGFLNTLQNSGLFGGGTNFADLPFPATGMLPSGTDFLGAAGPALGVAGGLFGLGSGLASGNPGQAAIGGINTLQQGSQLGAMTGLLGQGTGALLGTIGTVAGPFLQALGAYFGMPGVLTPSENWMHFKENLADTVNEEGRALQGIPQVFTPDKIKTKQDLADAIAAFKWAVEFGGVGNYSGQGAWNSIGDLPGAGGSAHEGGLRANLNQYTQALNTMFDQMSRTLPGDVPKMPNPNLNLSHPGAEVSSPLFRQSFSAFNPDRTGYLAYTLPQQSDVLNPQGPAIDTTRNRYDPLTDTFIPSSVPTDWVNTISGVGAP